MLIKNNNKLNSNNIFIFTTLPVSCELSWDAESLDLFNISPPALSIQWERAFQADTRSGAGLPNSACVGFEAVYRA